MKNYSDQVMEHLSFLQNMGLETPTLEIGKLIRCRKIGQTDGRGEYAYYCRLNEMRKGYVGLLTWCRGLSGQEASFKTYGSSQGSKEVLNCYVLQREEVNEDRHEKHEIAARKAYGFWQYSSLVGSSSYLERKGVGAHGIRFRDSKDYGNAAIVPMFDEHGKLWSCQILNADGSKRMLSNTRTKGLFHMLISPTDGKPIGIAESYVTAATCFELSEVPTVCCFSANNMPSVALAIRKLYPKSLIILFADNDRHLQVKDKSNKGLSMALESTQAARGDIYIVEPDFDDLKPSKEASDWNDLARIKGVEFTKTALQEKIMRNYG